MWLNIMNCTPVSRKHVIIGVMYILPESSKYFNQDELLIFEKENIDMCIASEYVLITGDANAHIAELEDFTESDDFLILIMTS
jgi:hypothetical protein